MFNNVPNGGDDRCKTISASRNETHGLGAKYVLLLALALVAPAALAQGVAPDALLRAVSVDVIEKIKHDQQLQAIDPAKVAALVETRIMPLFDFAHMTRLAMARNWRLATPEQQRVLTEEFRTLLVRTYSTALAHYRGEVIDFKQLRAAPVLPAQEVGPNVMLQSVTLEVIAALKQERDLHGGNITQTAGLVETKIVPLFDFSRMTQIALADKNRQSDSASKAPRS